MVILSQKIGFSRQSGHLTPSHSITQSPNLDLRFLTSVLFNVFTFFRLQLGQKFLILPQIITRIQNGVIAIKCNFIQFNAMQNYSFVFQLFLFLYKFKKWRLQKKFPQKRFHQSLFERSNSRSLTMWHLVLHCSLMFQLRTHLHLGWSKPYSSSSSRGVIREVSTPLSCK